jgi:drug/metabolite transporter (DMT)-like permease
MESRSPGVWLGLVVLYVVWGSTYLGIHVLLQTTPPFLVAGARFVMAGLAMLLYARIAGLQLPNRAQWKASAILGVLFFVGGNGGVVLSQMRMQSGIAALLVAMVPMWIAIIEAAMGIRPHPLRIAGVLLGMVGIGWLVGPGAADGVDPLGFASLIASTIAWATGTVLSRELDQPPVAGVGAQMLCGGLSLLVLGAFTGEIGHLGLRAWGWPELGAFAWLLGVGSLLGFTLYQWLLRHAGSSLTSTYAFVNPIVAVILGWLLAGEHVGARVIASGALIVAAVALIVIAPRPETRA